MLMQVRRGARRDLYYIAGLLETSEAMGVTVDAGRHLETGNQSELQCHHYRRIHRTELGG